jgi:hypothetical protein
MTEVTDEKRGHSSVKLNEKRRAKYMKKQKENQFIASME